MLATYVNPRRTVLTFSEAAEAMRAMLRDDGRGGLGPAPRRDVLALALAKCALETGRFQKMYCWNFGNIKAGSTYRGMFTCILLNEVIGGTVQWFAPEGPVLRKQDGGLVPVGARVPVPDGHPQTRMRAHANRFDGCFAYGDFMRSRSAMWAALHLGEPIAFVRAMKAARYFTADEAPYAKAVASLFREFSLKLEGVNPPETVLPENDWSLARALAVSMSTQALADDLETIKDEGLRELATPGDK